MKAFVVGNLVTGLTIVSIAAAACAVGVGHPNCEPTTYGYAEFWATLFACGCGAFTLAGIAGATLTYAVNKVVG